MIAFLEPQGLRLRLEALPSLVVPRLELPLELQALKTSGCSST
jgi:hypothetical protein